MKKTKGKRDDRIRVACESLSAQLAGANSHATRYWFDRDGLGFLGFKVQGKGILSPMVPQQTAAANGQYIHRANHTHSPVAELCTLGVARTPRE